LTALSGQDLARLLSYLEPVSLAAGRNVYELGEEVDFVYFPETAIVANFHSLEDGTTTEAAIIGNEGMVGVSAILDSRAPSYWTQVTIAGSAVKCRREVIKQEFARSSTMQEVLLKYMNVLLSQLSQRVVCNGSHHLNERLSTWLLMIHDRANGDPLSLTHEEIAEHLGTRRAGITSACNSLRSNGAISYSRGQMTVLDRSILKAAACECYETLRLS
jgi:CRP-like cAMP-binding protein